MTDAATRAGISQDEIDAANKRWGKNGWEIHFDCPGAVQAGSKWAMHSKEYHSPAIASPELRRLQTHEELRETIVGRIVTAIETTIGRKKALDMANWVVAGYPWLEPREGS